MYKANPTPENLQELVSELSKGKAKAEKLFDKILSRDRPLWLKEENFYVLQSEIEEAGATLSNIATLDEATLRKIGFNSQNEALDLKYRFFNITYLMQQKFLEEQFHKLDKMGVDFSSNIKNNTAPDDQK